VRIFLQNLLFDQGASDEPLERSLRRGIAPVVDRKKVIEPHFQTHQKLCPRLKKKLKCEPSPT
jgi:hypothetical protein